MLKLLRNITKHSLLSINILLAILLLCTLLIPRVNPNEYWYIGILGLATPFIAIANILFILFWVIMRKWKFTLVSLLAILLSWQVFSVGFAGNFSLKKVEKKKTFKVMTYNVRLLDLYKWSGRSGTRQQMLNYIQKQNADILCLQEFFSSSDSTGIQNVKDIAEKCGYAYNAPCKNFDTKRGFFGDIIFSKYPINNPQSLLLDTSIISHKFQFTDIAINKRDTIRLFNVHLASVKLDKKEIELLDVKKLYNDEQTLEKSKNILQKLKRGIQKRAHQVDVVKTEIQKSKYPCIVCGDLNDIPSTYTYFSIRGNLHDAFLDNSFGLGRTYSGISPFMRIDHILYDAKVMNVNTFNIDNTVAFSDHFPLIATFNWL